MAEIVTFGSWLKRARRQMDLTQKELAFQCACSVGTIRKIEADERQPSRQLARLIAETLHVPPERRDDFVAFARSEPHIDHVSFPTLNPGVEGLNIPALPTQESFGDWVQSGRNRLGLTRKAIAELVGCTPMAIRQIERNEGRPSLELAELLAAHLNIPESQYEQFIFAAWGEFVPRYGLLSEMSLAEAQMPAAQEETHKHNLPLQTTQFFGRERELTEIAANLGNPNCRLLTILAAGGMGKSRLSIEAARAQLPGFTDGVTYVELAAVNAGGSGRSINPLAAALADTLKFSFHGGDTPERQLFSHLRPKEMLLVLDNFEHLLETADFVSELLQNAPDLKILVTSRERLNLQEEWLFALQGLSFHEAGASDAVQLFTQRATQIYASFNLEAELLDVLKICQLVEGMPLGLELAAAWVLHLSCAEIAGEINSKLDFLASEMRNVPDRQRSMRAVFSYSWERITNKERDILKKLSVFRGGFDRNAAKAVTGASLRTLSGLVSKSLLSIGENDSFGKLRTPRYAVHELLRQFAAEKLAQSGSTVQEVRASHGRYFLTIVCEQDENLHGPKYIRALEALTQDMDNVRAAIRWTIQHQPLIFDSSMSAALVRFFEIKGWFLEAEKTFGLIVERLRPFCSNQPAIESSDAQENCARLVTYQLALSDAQIRLYRLQEAEESARLALSWAPPSEEPSAQQLRASVFDRLGFTSFIQGAYPQALDQIQQAEALFLAAGDRLSYAGSLFTRCLIMQHTGVYDAAVDALQLIEPIAAEFNFPYFLPAKWIELGKIATVRGLLDEAETCFDKGQELLAKINQGSLIAYVLFYRGEAARLKGDFAQAKSYVLQCIALAEEINTPHPVLFSYWLLGNLSVDEGNYETALGYFAAFEKASFSKQEHIGGPGWALLGLGRLEETGTYFAASLQTMLGSQARPIGLDALVGMANIKARTGRLEQALALLALVNDHPSSHFESREKAGRLWEELVAELPSELVSEAEARGREMDLMQTAESLLAEVEGAN